MKNQKKVSPVKGSIETEIQPHAAPVERLKARQKLPLISMLADTKTWFPPTPPEGFEFADFYHL